jgi:V8-like Glu-specific endopeptidase
MNKNWYKISSLFGTDPFGSSELSDKTRVSPWGNSGGDENFGLLEPSTGKNHPNRYPEEDDENPLIEKKLKELNQKRKRKRKRKNNRIQAEWYNVENKINPGLYYYNSFKQRIIKEAQWGSNGPKIPTWGGSEWFDRTYKNIMGEEDKSQPKETKETKEAPVPKEKPSVPIDTILQATVTINSTANGKSEVGSGFFVGPNLIVTCAHVVLPGNSDKGINIIVKFDKKEYPANIVAHDLSIDTAIISIKDQSFNFQNYLKIGSSESLQQGEEIITVGTPLGFENVVGKGIISSLPIDYTEKNSNKKYMFVSTNINPGNSGGPVIKMDTGEVIGIAAAVINTEEGKDYGLNAAIPIDEIKPFLKSNGINI